VWAFSLVCRIDKEDTIVSMVQGGRDTLPPAPVYLRATGNEFIICDTPYTEGGGVVVLGHAFVV
jgi:hypothetical protein